MKVLFYNPMELPNKVHIVSKAFGIDESYEEPYAGVKVRCWFEDLFDLAKCNVFEAVEVYLTAHNEAYLRKSKKGMERTPITGWFSLKGVVNGGGYLEDKLR